MVGEERQAWRCDKGRAVRRLPAPVADGVPQKTTRVVLATAHHSHDPSDDRPANLRALCQRCHILHDKEEHRIRRRLTYRAARPLVICPLGHTRRDPAPPSPSGPAAEDLAGLLERITLHNAENGFASCGSRRGSAVSSRSSATPL